MTMRFGIGHLFALTAACACVYSWWAPGPELATFSAYSAHFEIAPVDYVRVRTLADWQALGRRVHWQRNGFPQGFSFTSPGPEHEEIPIPDLQRADLLFFKPSHEREPIPGMEFLDQNWGADNLFTLDEFAAELKRRHQVELEVACTDPNFEFILNPELPLKWQLRIALGQAGCHFEVEGQTIRILDDRKTALSEIRCRGNGLVQILVAARPKYGEGGPSSITRLIPKYSFVWVLSPFAANCLDVVVTLLAVTAPFGICYLVQRLLKRRPELATANT